MYLYNAHKNLGSGSSVNCENWHILLSLKSQQTVGYVLIYETQ